MGCIKQLQFSCAPQTFQVPGPSFSNSDYWTILLYKTSKGSRAPACLKKDK